MKKIQSFTSSKESKVFFKEDSLVVKKIIAKSSSDEKKASNASTNNNTLITIDPQTTYQSMLGFGGSFTESASYVYSLANKQIQKKILNAYFGKEGLNYTLCRTHIQSCDFSLGNYAYVMDHKDKRLETFSIDRDLVYLIPFIKHAQTQALQPFRLIATPWSPPPFMKTNLSMTHGGSLKKEYADMWAQLLVKYILEYKKLGIDIWAMSIQNEPEAQQIWESCLYSAKEEGDFILHNLVPALQKKKLSPKIIAWDHNRDRLFERSKELYEHKVSKYIWGAGFHWYEEISTGISMHNEVLKTHKKFPDKHLLLTEACQEFIGRGVNMGDWAIGERYARNIIDDLEAWAEAWVDWNLVLNQDGGPNHVGNYCDAPIKYNTETRDIFYSNSYYYIGHFSKYIPLGAVRIKHKNETSTLYTTVWKDKEKIIVVILNTNSKNNKIELRFLNQDFVIKSTIPKRGIQTICIPKEMIHNT